MEKERRATAKPPGVTVTGVLIPGCREQSRERKVGGTGRGVHRDQTVKGLEGHCKDWLLFKYHREHWEV